MQIQRFSLGEMRANCYFIIDDKKCLIIDPGDEAEFILEKIQRENLEPVALMATHGHFDHIMAAGEIQLSYDIPFYIHEADLFLVKRLRETAEHFLEHTPIIIEPTISKFPNPNTSISNKSQFSKFNFQIILAPGHTPGSCCFYFPQEQAVFTGDTLFEDGIGSYEHSYSSKLDLMKSLERLKKLPEETVVYAGHGEEELISRLFP